MLLNKQISLASVAAYAGWLIAIGMWIVSWIADTVYLGLGAIIIALIAAVATSRLAANANARDLHNALTIVSGADAVRPLIRR